MRVLTPHDVQRYADGTLGTSVITQGNRCETGECQALKILAVRENRDRAPWQSFLLSRYLRHVGDRGVRTGYLMAERRGADWAYTADVAPPLTTAPLVVHAELVGDARRPWTYVNALAVYQTGRLVILPFGRSARRIAETMPWDDVLPLTAPSITVQQARHPWPTVCASVPG
jgi:hypothetical protein